jgi:hypothetical protein
MLIATESANCNCMWQFINVLCSSSCLLPSRHDVTSRSCTTEVGSVREMQQQEEQQEQQLTLM